MLVSHRETEKMDLSGDTSANLLDAVGWQVRVCKTLRERGAAITTVVELSIGFECI